MSRRSWAAVLAVSATVIAAAAVAAFVIEHRPPAGTGTRQAETPTSSSAATSTPSAATGDGAALYVKPADPAALAQLRQLTADGDTKDAAALTDVLATPQAVWLDGGTPTQVERQVGTVVAAASAQHREPVFVAYNLPGRDCAQLSAGGAANEAAYTAWIRGVATGLRNEQAIVLLEPDSLGLLPSLCRSQGQAPAGYSFTDAERYAELAAAIHALAADADASVYLDGTHSQWAAVGDSAARLVQAGVQHTRGFFLNVSNFQPTPQLITYGTWISDCIAYATDGGASGTGQRSFSDCPSQYSGGGISDQSTVAATDAWYQDHLGGAQPDTHFVIDTSRNGTGPADMSVYAASPYDQSTADVAVLTTGAWCNPPGAGLGLRPSLSTGVALLDAYLWVKTPGESDGRCDTASGTRGWNFTTYRASTWPSSAARLAGFDPLWGQVDPPAGAWFPAAMLGLIRNATGG